MIVKETKNILKTVCKEPARVEYEDTGRKEVKVELTALGERVQAEVPIKRKVMIDAVYEDIMEEVTVYKVEHGGETHEFASMSDAREFKKLLKGGK